MQKNPLRSLLLSGFVTLSAFAAATGAHAASVYLDFSGGNGTPLTVTLSSPVTITLTGGSTVIYPTFENVGNLFADNYGSGSLGYTIDGGILRSFAGIDSDFTFGDTVAEDMYFFPLENTSVVTGQTVTLVAGSFTTVTNVVSPAPASGTYSVFIADYEGYDIGSEAVAVPEPSAFAAIAGVATFGAVALRRRRQA